MRKVLISEGRIENGKIMRNDDFAIMRDMLKNELIKVATRDGGRVVLYKSRISGQYWELSSLDPGYHGEGGSRLEELDLADVSSLYPELLDSPPSG